MLYVTKLRLLREGAGCREYVLLNSAMRFSNLVCCFIYFVIIIFIFIPFGRRYMAFSLHWTRRKHDSRKREDDHCEQGMRRMHSEFSYIPVEMMK